jgi:hypothetical protein
MLKSRATIQTVSEPEPTLESVAPEWVELSGKLRELLDQEDQLLAKIRANRPAIDAGGLANFQENNILARAAATTAEGKPPRTIGASKKASDLLGKFTPAPVLAPEPFSHEPKIAKEQRELGEAVAAVREAIALLRPQVTKAHLDGSARLCALLMPKYKMIAARICAALIELGMADLEQRGFMSRYRAAARSTLRPVHATGSLGDPRDPQGELRRLLQWAAECGHFNLDDLPTEFGARKGGEIRSWPMA